MLFTELKTQNNEINSKYVIKEISDNLLLIPDPLYCSKPVRWIWDQSLMTVEINTITRVTRLDICMSCKWDAMTTLVA